MKTSERKEVKKEMEGPRNYGKPEPLNTTQAKDNVRDNRRYETGSSTIDNFGKQQIGKSVIITMRNGRSESGILRGYGQYDIALELPTKRILIVMKHAIDTVSIL